MTNEHEVEGPAFFFFYESFGQQKFNGSSNYRHMTTNSTAFNTATECVFVCGQHSI